VLRVLFRELETTARRYYGSGGVRSGEQRSQPHTVTVTGGRSRNSRDDYSDKSMLDATRTITGGIVQTNEVEVEYRYRKDGEDEELGMTRLPV